MTASETHVIVPSAGPCVMEDKKRAAPHSNEARAPPRKKLATEVNGKAKADRDADMPWKDDLERFQKDAIWRQMQEYKREKMTLENRVAQLKSQAAYHDDHLRVIDAWWRQLLDEVRTIVGSGSTASENISQEFMEAQSLSSALMFMNNDSFREHLEAHAAEIKQTVAQLYSRLPLPAPTASELQQAVNTALAATKAHEVELDKLRAERDQLEEQLENAAIRYIAAEKKLDRMKSEAVAKLEQHGLDTGVNAGDNSGTRRAENKDQSELAARLQSACKEAEAVANAQKAQLEKLEAENSSMLVQVTALSNKVLTDDDYIRSELCQYLKAQYEDVVKRVNHLEAVNIKLSEEASTLQAERTAYREKIEKELKEPFKDLGQRLERAETDLARIRSIRDQLAADLAISKSARERDQTTYDQMKELLAAKEDRISALECETERLRRQIDELGVQNAADSNLDDFSLEELKAKYRKLEQDFALISQELPAMGAAWKKASALASKKVANTTSLEEKVMRLQADKAKADQKFFQAMKAKDAREGEVKTLRMQNMQSSEIVAQLKEVEKATRQQVSNLERQLVETRDALTSITTQNRSLQHQMNLSNISTGGLKSQVAQLTESLKQKDAAFIAASNSQRRLETETEQLRVRLAEATKSLESWKAKVSPESQAETEALRTLALCGVCKSQFKNTAIKLCGHIFCKACIDDRLALRARRCPHCGKAFGATDVMPVHL